MLAAIYLRLSKEDKNTEYQKEGNSQSSSIKNQRMLILKYISNHPELQEYELEEYCDDGCSGTNFERSGMKRLILDARMRRLDCILVKDFSRFGRNYLEVGYYMEEVFPRLNVRFIAINDNFDSIRYKNNGNTLGLDTAIKNLIYDYYSKDLSQKVKASFKVKKEKGDYLGGQVPFGYKREQSKKGKIQVDEKAALIIQRIFTMTEEGHTRAEIARILNKEHIPTPVECMKKSNELNESTNIIEKNYYWTLDGIIRILRNETYLGKTITGKCRVREIGSKQIVLLPKEKWYTVQDTHESIISKEQYDRVQKTFRAHYANKKSYLTSTSERPIKETIENKSEYIIKGKITCGCCNYKMDLIKTNNPYYRCNSHRFILNSQCTQEHVAVNALQATTFYIIKFFTDIFQLNGIENSIKNSRDRKPSINNIKDYNLVKNYRIEGSANADKSIKYLKLQEVKNYEKFKNNRITQEEYQLNKEKNKRKLEELYEVIKIKTKIQVESKTDQGLPQQLESQLQPETRVEGEGKSYYYSESNPSEEIMMQFFHSILTTIYVYDNHHIEIIWNIRDEWVSVI